MLPPDAMGGFTISWRSYAERDGQDGSKQFGNLPPAAFGGFQPDQIGALPPEVHGSV